MCGFCVCVPTMTFTSLNFKSEMPLELSINEITLTLQIEFFPPLPSYMKFNPKFDCF